MTDKRMDLNKGLEQLSEMLDTTEGVTDSPFSEEPVDLDTFLYSGDFLRCPKLSNVQYEFVEALSDIYYGCSYTEVVAEWGKGGGKDMACAVALSRVVYSLLCLRDPAAYYKLKSGSKVEAINIAVNADQANSVFFSQFIGFLVDSPYFRRVGYKHRGGRVAFPKNIRAISGHSEMEGLEGHNVIVAILDEIDAFKTEEEVSSRNRRAKSAKFIYDRMCSSTQSRFPGLGKVACISFPRFFGSFIQKRREAGLKEPKTFVSSPKGVPTWIANPVRTREELEDEFRKDPERSEMMYGCNPPMARDAYFRHNQHILAAFGAVMENYEIKINEELRPVVREVHGYEPPRMKPVEGMEYFIHVDLAKNRERAGFALVCFDGEDLTIALSWAFPAPRGGEIDFDSIVKFITKLTEMGFVINKVTYDGWQSVGSLQELKRLGYDAATLSVKREHYDTLKDLFYSSNVKGYYYHLLVEELVNLELVNGKTIDHKSGFTDDASDALAGACWSAVRGSGMTPGIAVFGDDDEDEDDETGVIGELSEDNAMARVGAEIDDILRKSMHKKMTQIAEEDL